MGILIIEDHGNGKCDSNALWAWCVDSGRMFFFRSMARRWINHDELQRGAE